jgi:hypothetical protein
VLTVAIEVALDDQVPPATVLLNEPVADIQIDDGPVSVPAVAEGLTVTVVVA